MKTRVIHVLKSVSAADATTSQPVDISCAEKVTIVVKRSAHVSGNGAFVVEVSADGVNYVTYNKLIDNVANTNTQTQVRTGTKTLSANGVDFVTLSPEDGFKFLKVKVTRTTDGTHDAWVCVSY